MTVDYLKTIEKANHEFACKAIRVLAFAYNVHPEGKKADFADENDMTFIGLVGMIDPARKGKPRMRLRYVNRQASVRL